MKTRILLLIMVCCAAFSFNLDAQNNKVKKNNKEQIIFDVPMTCGSCQKRIEKNIPFEKGVSNLNVDLATKTVMVQFNPSKTNVSNLQKAFEKLGYTATVHEAKSK